LLITSMNQFTDIPASGQDSAFMREVQARKRVFLIMDTIIWHGWRFATETTSSTCSCATQQNISHLAAAQNSDHVTM